MLIYPAEFNARKAAVFAALSAAEGTSRRLLTIPWSLHDHPETAPRVALCLSRAKHQPNGLTRRLKTLLIRLQYNGARRLFARNPEAIAAAWNGLGGSRQAFLLAARDAGIPTLHAELAPFPGRITLDPKGVNADGSVPQDPAFFTTWAAEDPTRANDQWRAMGQTLTARPSRRTDVTQSTAPLPDTPFLFCPLQVPDDSQVTLFSGWSRDMQGFLTALGEAALHLPDGWHLRLKEHPSARTNLTDLIAPLLATGKVVLDNQTDSFAQLAASAGVVTLNSSMGLQAFFFDKPVITLGRAFFARAPLTTPAHNQPHLNQLFTNPQTLTFDALDRARFMTWLDRVYYPRLTDPYAIAEKLRQARNLTRQPPKPLPPQALMR